MQNNIVRFIHILKIISFSTIVHDSSYNFRNQSKIFTKQELRS